MGWARRIGVSWLVVLASAGAASAQDAPAPPPEDPAGPPPDQPPPPPPPPPPAPAPLPPAAEPVPVVVSTPVAAPVAPVVADGYPRELVLRPLILPQGGFEGSALFMLETYSTGGDSDSRNRAFIQPRLRYGFGAGEVELGASFLAYEPEDMSMFPIETETFQQIFVAGRFKVSPATVIGAELEVFGPAAEVKTYGPRAIAATKLHLSAASAAELAFKAGLNHTEEVFESSIGGNTLVLSSELRVQAQVAPEVAIEARALLAYYNPEDDGGSFEQSVSSFFVQTYGLRIVGSVSRQLDLSAGFDLASSTGDATVKLFSVGVAARRVP